MSIVVTGANGLVGSCAVERLASAGEQVIAIGRGLRRCDPRAEYVELDLANPAALQDAIEMAAPTAVLHCAAMTDVDACERNPADAWTLNVSAVEAVAKACRNAAARLVALSTDYVFDGDHGPYSETDSPNPRGVYASTKYAGELAALLLAENRAVCRVAVIYSGRARAKKTFAVGVVENLRAGKPVKAFHDQHVSPTLADNAAELCIAVLQSKEQGVFHCAGAEVVTRVEFCQRLARKLGADEGLIEPVALRDLKLPAPRPLKCGLKVDRVRALGATPLGLDASIARFLAEREQQ